MRLLDFSDDRGVRRAATSLGIGLTLFGIAPAVAPNAFARLFGLPTEGGENVFSAYRSIGVRDVVTGIGLISAAMHGGKLGPWLLSRTLIDGGDVISVSLAFARGGGNARMAALGALALGATVLDHALWHAARRTAAAAVEE